MDHASLKPGAEGELVLSGYGLTVRALSSSGSTDWVKLCLDLSLFMAGSYS